MADNMGRFTQRARRVLSLAHEEAEKLHHNYIGTEHLLLGLIREEGGVAGRVLRELGLDPARVKEVVERLTGVGRHKGGRVELAPGTERVLQIAIEEATKMGRHYIGTEHLLLGLVQFSFSPVRIPYKPVMKCLFRVVLSQYPVVNWILTF